MRRLQFVLLSIAVAGAAACGDESSDPAADGRTDTGSNTDTGGGTDVGVEDTGGGDDDTGGTTDTGGNTDAGDDTGGQTDAGDDDATLPDVGQDSGGEDGGGGEDTGGPFVCGEGVTFTGQVFGEDVPNGGVPVVVTSADDIAYPDGGLQAVMDAFPETGDPIAADVTVTEATVIATNFFTDAFDVPPSQSLFWVADASGAVEVRLDFSDVANVPEFDVRVGHRISFRATELGQYFGKGQVTAATDWQLLGTDGDVYVVDVTGQEIPLTLVDNLIRVTGTLVENTGPCGGDSECWNMEHGDQELVLRSESTFYDVGECVTYVGPLGIFSGAPQINETNFDWTRDYNNVGE